MASRNCIQCENLLELEANWASVRKRNYEYICNDCNKKKQRESVNRINKELRQVIMEHYGGKVPACACCGSDIEGFNQLDHINGGGSKERNRFPTYQSFYKWIVRNNFPPIYQVLCANCNWYKRENRICIHSQLRDIYIKMGIYNIEEVLVN